MKMNTGEKRFQDWLDYKGYPYLFVDQAPETFSTLFSNTSKRPDFLILIDSIGMIAVDVKTKPLSREYSDYTLDHDKEVDKLLSFERSFRIPVWIAFSHTAVAFRTWHWISVTDVWKKSARRTNRKDKREFHVVGLADCRAIDWEDGLGKLFGI
jgi:hypothetical protein